MPDRPLSTRAEPLPGFPAHVDRGRYRFVSGLTSAATAEGSRPPRGDVEAWIELADRPWHDQAEELHLAIAELLDDVGGHGSMLRQHIYQVTKRKFPVFEEARRRHEPVPTPSSGVGVERLRAPQALWEVDGIALSPQGRAELGDREVLDPGRVGAGASFYSQAVRAGRHVFTAGMIPVDTADHRHVRDYDDVPEEGRLLRTGRSHPDSRRGPIVAQTWFVYQNILGALEANGLAPDDLSNVTLFLSDSEDAADALRVHQELLGDTVPAVQLLQLDEIGHRGMRVEIEATALDGAGKPQRVGTEAPTTATRADDLVFVSDALGFAAGADRLCVDARDVGDARLGALVRHLPDDAARRASERALAQAWSALDAVEAAAADADGELGWLWVRVRRDAVPLAVVSQMLAERYPERDVAVTLLSVASVPQSREADVAVSAVATSS